MLCLSSVDTYCFLLLHCFLGYIQFTMAPLPPLSQLLMNSATVHGGYNRCLDIEKGILSSHLKDLKSASQTPLICVRILGFLLVHIPGDLARGTVGKEIVSCKSDQEVIDLGVFYNDHFIRCCEWLVPRCRVSESISSSLSQGCQGPHTIADRASLKAFLWHQ